MLLVDPAKDMGGIPELAAERIAELRRMAAELRQPRNYVERLEFSVSAERGSVKTVPTDYAKGFLPASAPEAKVVRATVGFSDAVQRANGSGSELRFRKTAAAEITLKDYRIGRGRSSGKCRPLPFFQAKNNLPDSKISMIYA